VLLGVYGQASGALREGRERFTTETPRARRERREEGRAKLETSEWKIRILGERLAKFGEVLVTVATARFGKRTLQLLLAIFGSSLLWAAAACAQNLDKPVMNVDDEVTAFAYAPDGRIVFSVRRMFKNKKYDMQRDDIFIAETNGKRRRILEGQKFTHGDKPFTYQVESFTWSPNGHIVAVQLFTTTVDPEDEHHDDVRALLLLDDSGRELHPMGPDSLVPDAEAPMWLRDNGTLVYLTDEMARELFSMKYLYVAGGPPTKAFEGRTFISAVRVPGSNSAIAIERDRNMEGPPRMQRLDLLSQDDKELATLDAYLGGLSVSPSGTKAAYFLDREVLEIRDLEKPDHVVRMRVGLGVVQWNADETEIYVKRTVEKKSADLVTFRVPQLVAFRRGQVVPVTEPEPRQLLHGLAVREYALSADGRYLAIVLPGKRNLQVFGF
jgi:dipeptidyl aminopeptidase/acylaminoacyl peptidase